jgi:ribosomal protein L11 methylase PrmA
MIRNYKEMQIVLSISNYETIYNALYLNGIENILIKDFDVKNWNVKWEKSIKPVYIRDKIVIYPSWKKHHIKDSNRKVNIEIDPKFSFGTGHNGTTQLILEMMCDHLGIICWFWMRHWNIVNCRD